MRVAYPPSPQVVMNGVPHLGRGVLDADDR